MYIDDIMIVPKGTKHELLIEVRKVMRILHDASKQMKEEKCVIAQECIKCLGHIYFELTSSQLLRNPRGKPRGCDQLTITIPLIFRIQIQRKFNIISSNKSPLSNNPVKGR